MGRVRGSRPGNAPAGRLAPLRIVMRPSQLLRAYPLVAWPVLGFALITALVYWCPGRMCAIFVILWWPQMMAGGGIDWLSEAQTLAVSLGVILLCSVIAQALAGRGRPVEEGIVFPASGLLLLPPAILFWGALLLDR